MRRLSGMVAGITLLGGCAVTQLEPGADTVRMASLAQVDDCRALGPVIGHENLTVSVDTDFESAHNKAMNATFKKGGDTFVLTDQYVANDGMVVMGQAFRCEGT